MTKSSKTRKAKRSKDLETELTSPMAGPSQPPAPAPAPMRSAEENVLHELQNIHGLLVAAPFSIQLHARVEGAIRFVERTYKEISATLPPPAELVPAQAPVEAVQSCSKI